MYSSLVDLAHRGRARSAARTAVPTTIVLLGVTSMLTDVSAEMVTAVLPVYLTLDLSFSAFQFGGYVGLAEAVQAVIRIVGGVVSDRRSDHKRVAVAGYATSAATRVGIVAAGGSWAPTTGFLLADRFGKGIRTAPRDAMISIASPPDELGRSFGVHRALDAFGALLGPLVAFVILASLPGAYDAVFLVSFSIALVGLGVLVLFVPSTRALVSRPERFRSVVAREIVHNSSMRRFATVAAVLGALTIGDAFIFLGYQRVSDIRLEFFPLLFTGMSVVYLLTAIPVGRLADRLGRRRVFLAGYAILGLVYASLFLAMPSPLRLMAVVGGLGLFYAATDGVVMAAVSELLGVQARATGLAMVASSAALGKSVSAVAFGALWTLRGPDTAFACFAAAIPVALVVAWLLFDVRTAAVPAEEPND